jgi:hypothetical protein
LKEKSLYYFHKKIKNFKKPKKTKKKTFLVGLLGGLFCVFFDGFFWVGFFGWVFLGGFFNANPELSGIRHESIGGASGSYMDGLVRIWARHPILSSKNKNKRTRAGNLFKK